MNWFPIALCCALFAALSDATSKLLMRENDEWVTGTVMLAISLVIVSPIVLYLQFEPISIELIIVILAQLPFEILGYYLFLSAIRMSPLSITVPLLAFSPVITIFTSWLIVGERISATGAIGVVIVAAGAYLLHFDKVDINLVAPIRAIYSDRGAQRMLGVAGIWALTSVLGKKGVLIYGALQYGIVLLALITAAFAVIALLRVRSGAGQVSFYRRTYVLFFLAGLFLAGMEVTHYVSISLAPVAYMLSVKRLSLVFGVLLGWLVFREEQIRYRLLGASAMVSGVFIIYY